jgi:hypothetical protein
MFSAKTGDKNVGKLGTGRSYGAPPLSGLVVQLISHDAK